MIAEAEGDNSSTDWIRNCVSVDIEAAGPFPAEYAMLSIGACRIADPLETFYVELKPDRKAFLEPALAISGLSMSDLEENGVPPQEALPSFASWLRSVNPGNPIFVAFNAPFDWMFINDYFHRYHGTNPFGYSAIDIKALYLGYSGSEWNATNMDAVNKDMGFEKTLSHHALEDALDQAQLFLEILKRIGDQPQKE